MFYDHYVRFCERYGVAPSTAARKAGISPSLVTDWKNGAEPSMRSLAKLRDFFDCDMAELMGAPPAPAAPESGRHYTIKGGIPAIEHMGALVANPERISAAVERAVHEILGASPAEEEAMGLSDDEARLVLAFRSVGGAEQQLILRQVEALASTTA